MNIISHTDNEIQPLQSSLEVLGGVLPDIESYLKRFKVFNSSSLFPPNFDNLQKNLCPICNRKLYLTANRKMAYCKSKVRDKFVIRGQTLLALGGSLA